MTARILVVDDIDINIRMLEAKLLAEYYEVSTAANGVTALEIARHHAPDLILLDVMMPGMDGFEVCRRLKADAETQHIPVVLITALSDVGDRVRGIEAGADDFLTKPVNDTALQARIRSLVRLKRANEEWRVRESMFVRIGGAAAGRREGDDAGDEVGGRILLSMALADAPDRIEAPLREKGHVVVHVVGDDATRARLVSEPFDLVLIDDGATDEPSAGDALRLCSQLRSDEFTRHLPILLMVHPGDEARLAKALELGVNDYLVKPIDRDEMAARVRAQIRRKRYEDELRANYRRCLDAALTDDLTGLNNRRYLEAHFEAVTRLLADGEKPLSLIILDVDRFKAVNDTYGHAAGDVILQGVAGRIATSLRGVDTAVRYGGEEFVVLMPNTSPGPAQLVADRLCQALAESPFAGPGDIGDIAVTASIGLAHGIAGQSTLDSLLHRADQALYEAKRTGRNRVVVARDEGDEGITAQTECKSPVTGATAAAEAR